jgi:hypothetical protein
MTCFIELWRLRMSLLGSHVGKGSSDWGGLAKRCSSKQVWQREEHGLRRKKERFCENKEGLEARLPIWGQSVNRTCQSDHFSWQYHGWAVAAGCKGFGAWAGCDTVPMVRRTVQVATPRVPD